MPNKKSDLEENAGEEGPAQIICSRTNCSDRGNRTSCYLEGGIEKCSYGTRPGQVYSGVLAPLNRKRENKYQTGAFRQRSI